MVSVSRASGRSYSGLKAVSMAVGAAAANIARIGASESLADAKIRAIERGQKPGDQSNGQSQDGYRPLRVIQQSLEDGGVSARYGAISPSYVVAFNPMDLNANDDGFLAMPNVDLAGEPINLGVAQRAYEAGLIVIDEAEEEMSGSLLDALN